MIPADHQPLEPPHDLGPIRRFDDAVDAWFDGVRGHEPFDRMFYALTELGDFSLLWYLIGWGRAIGGGSHVRRAVELTTALGVESLLVNGAVKFAFKRERPVVQDARPHRLRVPMSTSFPSGHASAATVAALILSDGKAAPVAAAWWGLAGLMASSRIYVRIHHASDVVGGAAVGLVIGVTTRSVIRRLRR